MARDIDIRRTRSAGGRTGRPFKQHSQAGAHLLDSGRHRFADSPHSNHTRPAPMNVKWKSFDAWSDAGLLIIRGGVGALFMCLHGFPRLMGGPDKWNATGRALSYLDIDFGHTAFGLAAALTMTFGGAFMIIGF